MNIDQAVGYLVRDPASVEAEAARVLLHEITSRGQETAAARTEVRRLRELLARVDVLANRWRSFGIIGPRRSDTEETQRRMYADLAALLDRALRDQP